MQPNEKKIWFPAKKYGWGWGPPCAWQGWVVLLLFIASAVAEILLIDNQHIGLKIALFAFLLCVLMAFCWIKGEPPRWRWGKD